MRVLLQKSKNSYIHKTIEASLKRIESDTELNYFSSYLPIFEEGQAKKLIYFYNQDVKSIDSMWQQYSPSGPLPQVKTNLELVFPHQQYGYGR